MSNSLKEDEVGVFGPTTYSVNGIKNTEPDSYKLLHEKFSLFDLHELKKINMSQEERIKMLEHSLDLTRESVRTYNDAQKRKMQYEISQLIRDIIDKYTCASCKEKYEEKKE